MRLFYDTEFIEDGRTIDLISIGMVADDGREYYAVSSEFSIKRMVDNLWLMKHVWPSLPQIRGDARMRVLTTRKARTADLGSAQGLLWTTRKLFDRDAPEVKARAAIAAEVRHFITDTPAPELWAWYGAYDHVALAQLFGRMVDLPAGVPMWTNDLKQECARLGDPQLPEQGAGQHNALADARHNRAIAHFLDEVTAGGEA